MSDATDFAAAKLIVQRDAQWNVDPALTDAEVNQILAECQRATTWVANTPYIAGAMMLPITRNGHRYKCMIGGTSGPTEPNFLFYRFNGSNLIEDGSPSDPRLQWREFGPDYANIYDIRLAVHKAWGLKASKSVCAYDVTLDSSQFHQSQVYDHCMAQAARWQPIGVA